MLGKLTISEGEGQKVLKRKRKKIQVKTDIECLEVSKGSHENPSDYDLIRQFLNAGSQRDSAEQSQTLPAQNSSYAGTNGWTVGICWHTVKHLLVFVLSNRKDHDYTGVQHLERSGSNPLATLMPPPRCTVRYTHLFNVSNRFECPSNGSGLPVSFGIPGIRSCGWPG